MAFTLKGKISVGPIVEMTGDHMANVIWQKVKSELIEPYLNLSLKQFDLSKQNRIKTDNKIIYEAANAIEECNVGIKCPTAILGELMPSAVLRKFFDGTLFREPLITNLIPPLIGSWKKPIIVARHASSDDYKRKFVRIRGPGEFNIKYTGLDDVFVNEFAFGDEAICYGEFARLDSIEAFAQSCFNYSLNNKLPLYISENKWSGTYYEGIFRRTFERKYLDFKDLFKEAGIWFDYHTIDNMVILALRSEGGFVWACKNHDGNIMGHLVSTGYGPIGLTLNLLSCKNHKTIIAEPAHGTIISHYERYLNNETTSTNVIATIFSWIRALEHRSKLDKNDRLEQFCYSVQAACVAAVESGVFSKDIADSINLKNNDSVKPATTDEFINEIANQLKVKLVMHHTRPIYEKADKPLPSLNSDHVTE